MPSTATTKLSDSANKATNYFIRGISAPLRVIHASKGNSTQIILQFTQFHPIYASKYLIYNIYYIFAVVGDCILFKLRV